MDGVTRRWHKGDLRHGHRDIVARGQRRNVRSLGRRGDKQTPDQLCAALRTTTKTGVNGRGDNVLRRANVTHYVSHLRSAAAGTPRAKWRTAATSPPAKRQTVTALSPACSQSVRCGSLVF